MQVSAGAGRSTVKNPLWHQAFDAWVRFRTPNGPVGVPIRSVAVFGLVRNFEHAMGLWGGGIPFPLVFRRGAGDIEPGLDGL